MIALLAGNSVALAQGGFLEQGRDLLRQGQTPGTAPLAPPTGGLTEQKAEAGLREALRLGTQRAIARVGKADGYFKDPAIRIPLPGLLEQSRRALRAAGAAGLLDDLELRMNRAAESAAPKAVQIFTDAIGKMSVADAKAIVGGPKDGATQYFKRTTTEPLTQAFRPIVERTLSEAGAVQAYDAVLKRTSGALAGLSSLGAGTADVNLTDFVLDKALAGLFHYVATEEAAIRANPAARTSELLRQVFGP